MRVERFTNDHGWTLEEWLSRDNFGSRTTKLGVDLHTDVGAVLGLSLLDVSDV